MIINVNDAWRIRSDPHQWILEQRAEQSEKSKAEGKSPAWSVRGYFVSLGALLNRLVELQVRGLRGEYPEEALEPLCGALSDIKADMRAVPERMAADVHKMESRIAELKALINEARSTVSSPRHKKDS